MPRFTGQEAHWESFRRELMGQLQSLGTRIEWIVVSTPEGAFVQFSNEGQSLLGECCDPRLVEAFAPQARALDETIRGLGWGPIDPSTGIPTYQAKWFGAGSGGAPLDHEDAADAANLAAETLRQAFGVEDARALSVQWEPAEDDSSAEAALIQTVATAPQAPAVPRAAAPQAPAAPTQVTAAPPQNAATVPLKEWRGMGKMTRKDTVSCRCRACGNQWKMDSAVSNTIAKEQGTGGRLQRAGLKMEQVGASLTIGASGRRVAAGNELHRANEFLGNLYTLAACPNCNSVDVLLGK